MDIEFNRWLQEGAVAKRRKKGFLLISQTVTGVKKISQFILPKTEMVCPQSYFSQWKTMGTKFVTYMYNALWHLHVAYLKEY